MLERISHTLENVQKSITSSLESYISASESCYNGIGDYIKDGRLEILVKTISEKALIVFAVISAVGLMCYNSTIFGIGVLFSLCAPKLALDICNRVQNTWNSQNTLMRCLIISIGTMLFPVTSVTATFLVGTYVCCKLQPVENFA